MTYFSQLNKWGAQSTPFIALVSFDGRLVAAPLNGASPDKGVVYTKAGALHYQCNDKKWQKNSSALIRNIHPPLTITQQPAKDTALKAISELQSQMLAGRSYLANYCTQTIVSMNYSPSQLFDLARAKYNFWLEGHFMAFSPETFITAVGNQISTSPMKGTGLNREALLSDSKEQAEHATVVDLLRNDLSRVAKNVNVDLYRYISEIRRSDGSILYQTSSNISGVLPVNWRSCIGDWLRQLLPAGSVTGAPKDETIKLIHQYESELRGFFTGVAVIFNGESLCSAVLIRYLDLSTEVVKFRSGAGVTIYSNPEDEYNEILQKVYLPL